MLLRYIHLTSISYCQRYASHRIHMRCFQQPEKSSASGETVNKDGVNVEVLRAKLQLNPHRPVLPSIFFANVQSLTNKMDYFKIWTLAQKNLISCSIFIFSETWLNILGVQTTAQRARGSSSILLYFLTLDENQS